MAWPEISIEDFPPERDDEPSSLRQDIIDELTDHFVCALNRELLKNPNEQTAKQRVLHQFGDPIKIARQLWLEEMKEKIMSQRIMTGISAVTAVCSILVVGIAWMLMKESQGVNQKILAQLAAIVERPQQVASPNVDQQILKQLEQINQGQRQQAASPTDEMNEISFQLVQDSQQKTPAVGFVGHLTGVEDKSKDSFTIKAVSQESGLLDFGKLPSGKYNLRLSSPWGETYYQTDITLIPGRNYSQSIVCPSTSPEKVPVQFQVNWSEKMKSEDWYLLCDFRERLSVGRRENTCFVSSMREIGPCQWFTYQNQNASGVYLVNSKNQVSICPLDEDKFKDVKTESLSSAQSINMVQGDYTLPVLYLLPKNELSNLSSLNSTVKRSVISKNRLGTIEYDPIIGPPSRIQRTDGAGHHFFGYHPLNNSTSILLFPFNNRAPSGTVILDTLSFKKNLDGIQLPGLLGFNASKQQTNHWQIHLPELENMKTPQGRTITLF